MLKTAKTRYRCRIVMGPNDSNSVIFDSSLDGRTWTFSSGTTKPLSFAKAAEFAKHTIKTNAYIPSNTEIILV